MHKSVFAKGGLAILGLAALASAQFKYWNVADTSKTPRLLSQTGFYSNIATKTVHSSAHLFEVNSALWSDDSHKKRWFILKQGQKIGYQDTSDYWTYPDSAVFVKEFAIDTIEGQPASRVLWETRFLIVKKELTDTTNPNSRKVDKWYGFSYRWNKAQTDAMLVPDTGEKASIKVQPLGKPAYFKKWIYPSRDVCVECHRTEENNQLHGRSVLGFFTAQINRNNAAGKNQILDFFEKGLFSGTKPTQAQLDNTLPKWIGIDAPGNTQEILEKKSRAYIAANCSGCHGARGMANAATFGVSFNYDYHTGVPKMKMEYQATSWPYGLDDPDNGEPADHWTKGVYLVAPGYPENSVILYRQTRSRPEPPDDITAFDPALYQMPPKARFEVNTKAMAVLEAWIKGIPQRPASSIHGIAAQPLLTPAFQGRFLKVPAELLGGNAAVTMTGIDGRALRLTAAGNGLYAVPAGVNKGIYIVRVGARSFTRYLF